MREALLEGDKWVQTWVKLTFTKVRNACAECLDVRIKRGKHLTFGFDTAAKGGDGGFSLFSVLAFTFENCLVGRLSDLIGKRRDAA